VTTGTEIRGAVLAGGASTRFGAPDDDKALRRVGAEPCLARIVATLRRATGGPPLVAVRNADQRATYAGVLDADAVQFAFDAPDYRGPLAGLRGAATASDATWLFCCGCDMPLLSAQAVTWLADRRDRGAGNDVDAVAVEHPDGTLEPLHTLYRRERVVEAAERLPRAAGPRALLAELAQVRTVPPGDAPASVPLARSLTNFNTREEFEAVRDEAGDTDRTNY
jgi:molybdopterin-guanine dinucleotide biosynthesis protein A